MTNEKFQQLTPAVLLGLRIRKVRHTANRTQDEVSEACGIYRTYLSRIEGGTANPTINVLYALAETLKVDISVLFSE
jgi:transcriptional regulator with XRE-family HTH domain